MSSMVLGIDEWVQGKGFAFTHGAAIDFPQMQHFTAKMACDPSAPLQTKRRWASAEQP